MEVKRAIKYFIYYGMRVHFLQLRSQRNLSLKSITIIIVTQTANDLCRVCYPMYFFSDFEERNWRLNSRNFEFCNSRRSIHSHQCFVYYWQMFQKGNNLKISRSTHFKLIYCYISKVMTGLVARCTFLVISVIKSENEKELALKKTLPLCAVIYIMRSR